MNLDQSRHLTYCSNIHPGETWTEVKENLETYLPDLKQKLSPNAPFGVGLRLSDLASRELLANDHLKQLQAWLAHENLYVFTLNGFPYGSFHHQRIKDQVYAPDWSQPARLDYTLRLVQILAVLLPNGMEGSISTVPLSYKPWWINNDDAREAAFVVSTRQLVQLVAQLVLLRQRHGTFLHLNLEPEPDGLLENTADVLAYFKDWLLPLGSDRLAEEIGISKTKAEQALRDHIQICYDTCHFAVEYESPQQVFEQFQGAGIKIGKAQLSAALRIEIPDTVKRRQALITALTPFAESTYLHQVIERRLDGSLHRYTDLPLALPHLATSHAQEWRTHFHVPIFMDRYQAFESTQTDISAFLTALQHHPGCQHLEIETYTWNVLPPEMQLDISTSIQREYEWVLDNYPTHKSLHRPLAN